VHSELKHEQVDVLASDPMKVWVRAAKAAFSQRRNDNPLERRID
jgi:hypothetical protein